MTTPTQPSRRDTRSADGRRRANPRRRAFLGSGLGASLGASLGAVACGWAVAPRAAHATPESLRAAVAAFTGGVAPQTGRVRLEIAELVENGNTVPVAVSVESPMTAAEHVRRIALFTERNPEPGVIVFHLSPRSGRARVATRMRLATTQTVLALAHLSDGSFWQASMDVVVTLAACVEN